MFPGTAEKPPSMLTELERQLTERQCSGQEIWSASQTISQIWGLLPKLAQAAVFSLLTTSPAMLKCHTSSWKPASLAGIKEREASP